MISKSALISDLHEEKTHIRNNKYPKCFKKYFFLIITLAI